MATDTLPQGGKPPVGPNGITIWEAARATLASADPVSTAAEYADYFSYTAPSYTTAFSRLAHYRNYLRVERAPRRVIEAAKKPEISHAYNDRARNPYFTFEDEDDESDQPYYDLDEEELTPEVSPAPRARRGRGEVRRLSGARTVTIPPGMDYESVRARLESYDTSAPATEAAVIDVMMAVSARPVELMRLDIAGGNVIGYAKGRRGEPRPLVSMTDFMSAVDLLQWAQTSIADGAAPDPGTPYGARVYRKHLQPMNLALKDLRVLGAEYASRANAGPRATDAEKIAWRRAALRHDPRSVSAAESYAIVSPR